ncbi:hypothetical protein GCM10017044_15240 [Kordiimonas sediminis]|uniref:Uncharacterized protein n=1 Tax=Kordiimonas sediminis TaxID=1735581 RepID=A0A919E820_9PROT|nr:hypothetical protein [Kordiimonas sediminis]GHF22093.1 hypothetical protein GCM10017044_15240 [Kordiimonas sediminis]
MANEVGRSNAGLVKRLLLEGRNGQDIALLLGVNSRAISTIKKGDDYKGIVPDATHNITSEVFELSKLDFYKAIGPEKTKEIHRNKFGSLKRVEVSSPSTKISDGVTDTVIDNVFGMLDALDETDYSGTGGVDGDTKDPVFLKHLNALRALRKKYYT